MEGFELSPYIRPLRKWWWLLLASALLAGLSTSAYLVRQSAQYESRTTLLIGSVIQDPNPNGQEFYLAGQLAKAYADFVNRSTIRQATKEALDLDVLPSYEARASGQLLDIIVVDTDPKIAQLVAAELANQLILMSPAQQGEAERRSFVSERLEKLEKDIAETEAEIDRKQIELGDELSASRISRLEAEIKTLTDKVSSLQSTYADLYSTSQGGAANAVYLLEPAGYPSRPIPKGFIVYLLTSVLFAFVLASGAAFVIEYLDDSIRSATSVQQVLDLSTLGAIPRFTAEKASQNQKLIMLQNARQPEAEAYRVLRTNLLFASVDHGLRILQVTSPSPQEGKSLSAANLSAALAQAGQRVILVDGDLRRPTQQKLFRLSNSYGITSALLGHSDSLDQVLQSTSLPNLRVLTSGPLPPNPAELVGSNRMRQLLQSLCDEADIVVIDSPPTTVVSDATIIASYVDGVLLVLMSGQSRKADAKKCVSALEQVNARLLGVLLNGVSYADSGYYYNYGKQYEYSYGHSGLNGKNPQADVALKQRGKQGRATNVLTMRTPASKRKPAAQPVSSGASASED